MLVPLTIAMAMQVFESAREVDQPNLSWYWDSAHFAGMVCDRGIGAWAWTIDGSPVAAAGFVPAVDTGAVLSWFVGSDRMAPAAVRIHIDSVRQHRIVAAERGSILTVVDLDHPEAVRWVDRLGYRPTGTFVGGLAIYERSP